MFHAHKGVVVMCNVRGINECTVANVGEICIKQSVWNEEMVLGFASSPDGSLLFLQHVIITKLP